MKVAPMLNILMTGDVVGESGRRAVLQLLPVLRQELDLDLVVVNGENGDGIGLKADSAKELLAGGVDVLTLGDHIYDKSDIVRYLPLEKRILRPLNFNSNAPGHDRFFKVVKGVRVLVLSVVGLLKIGIYSGCSPFVALDKLLDELKNLPVELHPGVILIDFHAEDISEKQALGWYLDGKVTAVVGTHTHVPTLDARILPKGTGRVTDIGMCGPRDSSLGMAIEAALTRFVSGLPAAYEVASGTVQFNSVLLRIDEETCSCIGIERIDRTIG